MILDFCQGADRIDLRGYANTFAPDRESAFLGEGEFGASLGLQVRTVIEEGRTIVQLAAVFGNPPPDFPVPTPSGPNGEIELAGVYQLTAADFILS